ncbi:hypothetical protein D3C80_1507380 [compost metagenome]
MPIELSLSELLDHAAGEMKVGEGPLALMGYRSQQVQPTRLRATATAQKMGLSTLHVMPPEIRFRGTLGELAVACGGECLLDVGWQCWPFRGASRIAAPPLVSSLYMACSLTR